MSSLTVRIDDRELMEKLKNASDGKAFRQALQDSAFLVQKDARGNAPYKTGNLRRSIVKEVQTNFARIGTNLIYARIHEFGGTIKPKRAKYLCFQVNGRWVMSKSVKIKARPYLNPALNDNKKNIKEIFIDQLSKVL